MYKQKSNDCENTQQEFIWYNSKIQISNQPFIYINGYRSGLKYIFQLLDERGKILPLYTIRQKFNLSVMQCNSLLAVIPKEWITQNERKESVNVNNTYEKNKNCNKLSAKIYHCLNENVYILRHAFEKWNRNVIIDIDFDQFVSCFKNLYLITNNSKLRSFQFRILHSAIILNKHLFKWKLKKSDKCTFCDEQKEDAMHCFVTCKYVQELWQQVYRLIFTWLGIKTKMTANAILLNRFHGDLRNVINFIGLVTKQYIYAIRCKNDKPNIFELERKIHKFKNFEYYQAKKVNLLDKHKNKWTNIATLSDGENML